MAHLASKVYKVGNQSHPWPQHYPHHQLPCSFCPWSTHRENHHKRKAVQTWKREDCPPCNWPDNCPTGAQPPWPMTKVKLQAHLCTQMPVSVLWDRRSAAYLHRATTYWAHWAGSTNLPCFQHEKKIFALQTWSLLVFPCYVVLVITRWFLTMSHSICQISYSTKTTTLYPHSPPSFCT